MESEIQREGRDSVLKRLAEFLRSVIPADPAQLLFVIGVVCFVIAPRLRWWPAGLPISHQYPYSLFGRYVVDMGVFLLLSIIFAGLAGYFVCFWPGDHPTRRVLCAVCLPALAGFGLLLARFLYLTKSHSSILETVGPGHGKNWVESLWSLPAGFHVCLIGLVLVLIFATRMAFGIATLPLALPENSVRNPGDNWTWRRITAVIWVLVGPLFCLYALIGLSAFGISTIFPSPLAAYVRTAWFSKLSTILDSIPLVFMVWLAGRENGQALRTLIRFPGYGYFLAALGFPVGIGLLVPTGQYFVDRVTWAAYDFGKFDQPQLGSYFAFSDPWLLLFFFSSFFEEVIFRGLLQPRFLQRYGLYRGIFLVGMVWAAFHFPSDFSFGRFPDGGIILHVGLRAGMCVAHSFVFGWLTIRSQSVFPAAIAHTLYNVGVSANFGLPFQGRPFVDLGLWAVLAYVLFRYWSVKVVEEPPEAAVAVVDAAPAV